MAIEDLSEVLTPSEAREHVVTQIGKALYSLDDTRPIYRSYRDLPATYENYVLVEAGTLTQEGITDYASEITYDETEDVYYETKVYRYQQPYVITAANDYAEDYLMDFKMKRHTTEWLYTYFNNEDIGIYSISDIVDRSVLVNGSSTWETRWSVTLLVNYLVRTTNEVNAIEDFEDPTTTVN